MRYLSEIAATIRDYHHKTRLQMKAVRRHHHLQQSIGILQADDKAEYGKALDQLAVKADLAYQGYKPGDRRPSARLGKNQGRLLR